MWARRVAAPPDLDRLPERVEEAVTERVADVGVVEAAVPRGFSTEVRQLVCRGVAAGRVVEPGADAEGPFRHALAEHRAHRLGRSFRGRLVFPADRADPQRRVADQVRDVDADLVVKAAEVGRNRVPVVVDVRVAVEPRV